MSQRSSQASTRTLHSLSHGADIISGKLRTFGSYVGLMFTGGRQQVSWSCVYAAMVASMAPLIGYLMVPSWSFRVMFASGTLKTGVGATQVALSIIGMLEISCVLTHGALMLIVRHEHSRLSRHLMAAEHLVRPEFQARQARLTLTVFAYKGLVSGLSVVGMMQAMGAPWHYNVYIVCLEYIYLINLFAPVMYTCYMGRVMGEHVRNFARIHVEPLFRPEVAAASKPSAPPAYTCSMGHTHAGPEPEAPECRSWARRLLEGARKREYSRLDCQLRLERANQRRRPLAKGLHRDELILRDCVARSQQMVVKLRVTVDDIGRTTSPYLFGFAAFELMQTIFVVVVGMGSKAYESLNSLHVAALLLPLTFFVGIHFVCTSYDEAAFELRVMCNSLFDLIVLNTRADAASQPMDSLQRKRREMLLEEIWIQFRYLRDLTSDIKFTCAGVITVTRRFVLVALGHMLSYAFLSIEIMHMIPG